MNRLLSYMAMMKDMSLLEVKKTRKPEREVERRQEKDSKKRKERNKHRHKRNKKVKGQKIKIQTQQNYLLEISFISIPCVCLLQVS